MHIFFSGSIQCSITEKEEYKMDEHKTNGMTEFLKREGAEKTP